jgi:hypothetical protein
VRAAATDSRGFLGFHLQIPFLVAKRTDTARLEPALDAIQMKHVSTVPKGNAQTIVVRGRRIGLVFNRRFVEGISTNGALKMVMRLEHVDDRERVSE